jgi:uncharacterized protein
LLAKLALLLCAFAPAASSSDVPKNDGWVTDLGDMLTDSEERSLEALMESYKSGTTHEIALLSLPHLDGEPIERLSLEIARSWGIGGAAANNGALLVVSRDDHELRIEVGRGLEGTLTDSVAGRIIRDVITPDFKRGRFEPGMRSGLMAMHAAIGGDYGPIERTQSARRKSSSTIRLIVTILVLLAMGLGNRGGRGGSNWPLWFLLGSSMDGRGGGGGRSGGGFSGFGGGGGFSGGGASGGW